MGDLTSRLAASSEVGAFSYLAVISVWLTVVDARERRIPNAVVLPSYPIAAVLLLSAAVFRGHPERALGALGGMVALLLLYAAGRAASPVAVGAGDVKLAGVLGLYLGFFGTTTWIVGACAAWVLGGLCAGLILLAGRAGPGSSIPFGPWMLAGAWCGIVASSWV